MTELQQLLAAMRRAQREWFTAPHQNVSPEARKTLFQVALEREDAVDQALASPASSSDRMAELARRLRDRQSRYFRDNTDRTALGEAKKLEAILDKDLASMEAGQGMLF